MNLTPADVKKLVSEPSGEVRGMLASKIAMDYRAGNFTDAESAIANDIFRLLIRDVERTVRKSLAEHLAHCPKAPRDIILKFAQDESDIAVHVLEHSQVLTQDDLLAVLASTREVVKLRAIARRENLPADVSGRLIDTRQASVLADLFKNKTAELADGKMSEAWDYIVSEPTLLTTLVYRGGLSLSIAEKVFHAVTDELKRHMAQRYRLKAPYLDKALSDIREWEMLGIVPTHEGVDPRDDIEIEDLVDDLHMSGRLTYSLLIRALCVGNMGLFEAGIARLAGVPRVNARMLLMDGGVLGIDAIYKQAGLPEGFCEAVATLLRISFEETEYGRIRKIDFRKRVIERIYMGRYNQTVENMEYLLAIIGGKIAATANVA